MSRSILAIVLLSTMSSTMQADEPFEHPAARAAQKEFQDALAKLRMDYAAKLEAAAKAAGADGELEEAVRVANAQKQVEAEARGETTDPVEQVRRKIEGSIWGSSADLSQRQRFEKNGVAFNPQGAKMAWVVTDKNTMVVRSYGSGNIIVWRFDDDLKNAASYSFKQDTNKGNAMKRIR